MSSGLIIPGRPEAEIVRRYPALRHLLYLREAAWRFLPIQPGRDEIDGVRVWTEGWRDGIRFRTEDDALGVRLDRDTRITWEFTGSLTEVVQELLILPSPSSRLAPRLARGRGSGLR